MSDKGFKTTMCTDLGVIVSSSGNPVVSWVISGSLRFDTQADADVFEELLIEALWMASGKDVLWVNTLEQQKEKERSIGMKLYEISSSGPPDYNSCLKAGDAFKFAKLVFSDAFKEGDEELLVFVGGDSIYILAKNKKEGERQLREYMEDVEELNDLVEEELRITNKW